MVFTNKKHMSCRLYPKRLKNIGYLGGNKGIFDKNKLRKVANLQNHTSAKMLKRTKIESKKIKTP